MRDRKFSKKDACLIAIYNDVLSESIAKVSHDFGRKLESISEEEIKARDRVDIALEEYENMKLKIRSLESEVRYLCSILEKIEAPIDKKIIPDSIRTYYSDDYENFRRVFKVEFAIDGMELR